MNLCRVAITAILVILPSMLHAAGGALITSPGTGYLFSNGNGFTVGDLFRVGADPLQITSLGMFDGGAPGLDQSHSVGLWTDSGTLLGRVDFSPGLSGSSANGFLYLTLSSPVTLQPGSQYVIGVSYPVGSTDGVHVNDSIETETWSSAAHLVFGRYTADGAGFIFPPYSVGGLSYVGPNALFTVVPEPGTVGLAACAASVALCFRLRPRPK
jgi:hypothetical protein